MKNQRKNPMKKSAVAVACVALLLCSCGSAGKEAAPGAAQSGSEEASVPQSSSAPAAVLPTQLSERYVDYDNPSFEWKGKLYTLGHFTLQDLVDAGAIFCDDGILVDDPELVDPQKVLRGNWAEGFDILLEEGSCFFVTVYNNTEEPKKAADCTVTDFSMWTNEGEPQDLIRFSCPYDVTWDQIIENAGTPSEIGGDEMSGDLDYTRYADETSPRCSYGFSFFNGKLSGFSMYVSI